jgi:dienelactone hydrolase
MLIGITLCEVHMKPIVETAGLLCQAAPAYESQNREWFLSGKGERERQLLMRLLGGFPPVRWTVEARLAHAASTDAMRCERLTLSTKETGPVEALITGPPGDWGGLPAVIYCHAHGNRYGVGAMELIEGRPSLAAPPYGFALAEACIVSICLDMPCFGRRQCETEQELSKRLLWQGQTLFGQMLCELTGLFDVLTENFAVDAKRIGTLGLSMGATHAFWLGALEPRIKAVAHLCAFADLGMLVRSGAHDLHGIYMMVPGLIQAMSTGQIAGLVAPRPQLVCLGAEDPLTPEEARMIALAELEKAYAKADEQLEILVENNSGHKETVAMRQKVMAFLTRQLVNGI